AHPSSYRACVGCGPRSSSKLRSPPGRQTASSGRSPTKASGTISRRGTCFRRGQKGVPNSDCLQGAANPTTRRSTILFEAKEWHRSELAVWYCRCYGGARPARLSISLEATMADVTKITDGSLIAADKVNGTDV